MELNSKKKSFYLIILIPAYLSVIILFCGTVMDVFFLKEVNVVIIYENRFSKLRQELSEDGLVGYITDKGELRDFFLTQYVMAPLKITEELDIKPDKIIGNFLNNNPSLEKVPDGYFIIKDFGDGVVLFSKDMA